MTISNSTIEALRELQAIVWQANDDKGFHQDRPDRADFVAGERGDRAFTKAVRDDQTNRLMLIVGEASEGHDELRSGHAVGETYYIERALPSSLVAEVGVRKARELIDADDAGKPRKPEGVPSELADIVIRCFDMAGVEGIDLAGMIGEKIVYNATRPFKHGRKF